MVCTYDYRCLTSKEQYEEIKSMEGSWYRNRIHIGYDDMGIEIVTFTGVDRYEAVVPRDRYLDVIRKGLKEKYQLDDGMIENYLNKAKQY